jgi:hypothetical protein
MSSIPATDVPSTGMELRLTGVPNHLSAHDLEWGLRTYLNCEHNLSVILEKPSEELFWKSFGLTPKDDGMAARVIVPDNSDGNNPAAELIDRTITIRCCNGNEAEFRVGKMSNSETPNRKLLRDGQISDLRKVSYGTFNDKKFETAHAWSYDGPECKFRKLGYFGDAKPPKFRVCLPEELGSQEEEEWEWMDFHEANLLGLIFESPEKEDQTHQVVYFVVDKPPQFYRRSGGVRFNLRTLGKKLTNFRLCHPNIKLSAFYMRNHDKLMIT